MTIGELRRTLRHMIEDGVSPVAEVRIVLHGHAERSHNVPLDGVGGGTAGNAVVLIADTDENRRRKHAL